MNYHEDLILLQENVVFFWMLDYDPLLGHFGHKDKPFHVKYEF